MAYLDSSPPPDPSFLQTLARSLGIGGQTTPVDPVPNRAALASALSGQPPPAPPGAHYAHLPGPPLLLPGGEVQSTAEQTAPAPAVVPTIAPQTAPIHGSVADIAQPDIAKAAVTPPASVVVPGYEAKGPLTRAQVSAAPDDDKTMPAEEDWDAAAAKAAKPTSGVQVAQAGQAAPSQSAASIYDQALKSRYDQQEQLYNRFNAQAAAARTPEIAEIFARQAAAALAEGNRILDERQAQLKPGWRTLKDEELTPAERATETEYQLSPEGQKSQVPGTGPDATRAPTDAERARARAAGINPDDIQVTGGKIELIKTGEETNDIKNWRAENADNVAHGLPERKFQDFLADKKAFTSANVILGKDGNPVDENLTGPALFDAVPPTVSRFAKGMLDGSVKLPNMGVRTDPTAKQAFLVAQGADSSLLDVNKVAARREIEAGYAKSSPGTLGGQVNAGNTAADHLADVVEAADDLKNVSGGGVPLIAHIANNLRNNISTQQSGKAGAFEDGLLHYGEEIAKFYAGAQTGEAERLRFLTALGAAKSPEEIAGVFRMEARQLGGKFITLDEQVRSVMDQAAGKYPVVRSSTKANAARITSGLAALDPVGPEARGARSPTDAWPGIPPAQGRGAQSAPTNTGEPVRIQGDADYAKLPSGATFIGPDGQTRTKR